MRSWAGLLAAALAAGLAACGPRVELKAQPIATEAERAGYLQAPEITRVTAAANGAVVVHGLARPLGRVRAILPTGEAYGATADEKGRFALELPRSGQPLLVSISAEEGARSTPAEGWLFAPAGDPAGAAILRAGAASRGLAPGAGPIAVVDFDAGGGAGVSGMVTPNSDVRLSLDGAAAGQVRADPKGRYALRLDRVPPGIHRLRVATPDSSLERTISFAPGAPAGRFTAARTADAWRIDWQTPGGGSQTTLVFSPRAHP
jgi:hypothetical protein